MSEAAPSSARHTQDCETLETRVSELRQLFNAMDPAPFRERDLDPRAEEFIVGWAREVRSGAPLELVVRLGQAGDPKEVELAPQAISQYFEERGRATRRQLRQLLRNGRTSLLIGLAFMGVALVIGDVFDVFRYGLIRESLVIGGWVAMWRPLEIFLYDWWPVRAEARLYDRLAAMPVHVVVAGPAT